MSAIEEILQLARTADPYRGAPENLRQLQMDAVRERFAQRRKQVKVLAMRADDLKVSDIKSMEEIVPLLFAHTSYKTYPESFIDSGKWKHMNLWLSTMSAVPVEADVAGVADADDWIARLRKAGHYVFASSGTSGKCSFLDQTAEDVALSKKVCSHTSTWANEIFQPAADRPYFGFFPPSGTHKMCEIIADAASRIGAPGEIYWASEEPLLASQTIRGGQLRRAISAGTATPDQISEFERENADRNARMQSAMARFFEKILDYRHRPTLISGMWSGLYSLMLKGRELGIPDGDFHPETVIINGGGIKGANLPPDFREQIRKFFGLPSDANWLMSYGMVEMTGLCPWNRKAEGYAVPPWIVPLVLDKKGEVLLNPSNDKGEVEGRMALFDIATQARWGGVISGDKVVVDFSSKADGLNVPVVRSVGRYSELEEGEDKLSCAGTIESYVRGVVEG